MSDTALGGNDANGFVGWPQENTDEMTTHCQRNSHHRTQFWPQFATQVLAEWHSLLNETQRLNIQLVRPTTATSIDADNRLANRLLEQFMQITHDSADQQTTAQVNDLVASFFGVEQTNLQSLSLE